MKPGEKSRKKLGQRGASIAQILLRCSSGSGVTAIHLSLICMTERLGWTDCHTFVSYLYDSKAWVD